MSMPSPGVLRAARRVRGARGVHLMKGADLLVAALENEGVQHIFGVPGEENRVCVDALRRSRITFVMTRHEQAAAFMAATHGPPVGRAGIRHPAVGPRALKLYTVASSAMLGPMTF